MISIFNVLSRVFCSSKLSCPHYSKEVNQIRFVCTSLCIVLATCIPYIHKKGLDPAPRRIILAYHSLEWLSTLRKVSFFSYYRARACNRQLISTFGGFQRKIRLLVQPNGTERSFASGTFTQARKRKTRGSEHFILLNEVKR